MAVAGHIVANLTTNTTGWSSGLKAALGPLQGLASQVMSLAVGAVTRFAEVGASLDDMSQRTGISASELSKLSFAADQSDASMEGLQKGLMKMNSLLLDTSQGSAGAKSTLDGLGLSVGQLNSADAVGKFGMFADALNRIEDPGERAAVAMKVFGKSAVELLPLLAEGSEGLDLMASKVERGGLVLTNAAAAAAARLDDAWSAMVKNVDSLVIAFGSQLAPIVTGLLVLFTEWIQDNRQLIIQLANYAVVFAGLIGVVRAYTLAVQGLVIAKAMLLALGGPAMLALLGAGFIAASIASKQLRSEFVLLSDVGQEVIDKATKARIAKEQLAAKTKLAKTAVNDFAAEMQQLRKTYDSLLPKTEQVNASIAKMATDWKAAQKAGADLKITWDQLKEAQTRTLLNESGFSSAFDGLRSELAVLRGEITETEQQFSEMAAFGVDEKHISKLREMMKERDKLLSEQAKEEKAKEETANRIADVTSRVQESQSSPLSRFAEEVKAVEEAVASGSILATSGLTYLEQLRERMLKEAEGDAAKVEQRGQASNVGLDARSAQANQAIVDLVNRRAASPEQTALAEQKKATALAEQSKALLTDIRDETRRRSLPTRPFGQRS